MKEVINVLGWPHLTFIFAIIFIIVFKKPLTNLIDRTTSIDKGGIKTELTPEHQHEKKKNDSVNELLMRVGDSIVIREFENRIKHDLDESHLNYDNNTDKVLIKHLAAAQIIIEFERIYSIIFGSQITLLKQLNEVSALGRNREYLVSYFEYISKKYEEVLGKWSFEQYISFLFERYLIIVSDNFYRITPFGVEFLTWMIRNGRSENRLL